MLTSIEKIIAPFYVNVNGFFALSEKILFNQKFMLLRMFLGAFGDTYQKHPQKQKHPKKQNKKIFDKWRILIDNMYNNTTKRD